MKQILFLFLTLFSLISCNQKHQLESQPRLNLNFEELPDTIQYYYLKSIEPVKKINQKRDTLTIYDGKSKFLCLNPEIKRCECEIDWFITFVDEYLFYVDNHILTMGHNSNTINEPYIIYKNQFYFKITRILYDEKDVKEAKYGKFDLAEILKKENNR